MMMLWTSIVAMEEVKTVGFKIYFKNRIKLWKVKQNPYIYKKKYRRAITKNEKNLEN